MTHAGPVEPDAPAHPGEDDAVTTKRLSKTYAGGFAAVDGVDLAVRRGEIFGLLGPNGAGKTTTIGMLTTRVVPTGGSAVVNGVDVVAAPARAKQQIGVVPQTNTLDRSLSVWENLYFHGRYFGMGAAEARERADTLLDRFHLAEKARQRTDTLSGGMAQRLMVARALLHQPAVLFLDEPTTGLDPQSRIALWDLLHAFHAEGQTILLTTHYMEEADHLCERVAVMDAGRILALGPPAELKASVDADGVVRVSAEGDLPDLAARLADVDGVGHVDTDEAEVRVWASDAAALLPALMSAAGGSRARVTGVRVSEPTLESVFIALTGRELRE